MEDIDVFRADEGLLSNIYNPGTSELNQSFFMRNVSAVDCTLFPRFFAGANMGALRKTFGFSNVCVPQSTGSSTWQSIGKKGIAVSIYDDSGKPWTTSNYVFSITNLWVAGARSGGFADSEIKNPERISMSVVNNLAAPKIPAVPNRAEVNWTCPWKRTIGSSLQRDVRLATPEAGEKNLVELLPYANLLEDRNATKSVWQRSPSWQVKLDATTIDPDDGARIYRVRDAATVNTGIYCDITDGFLRRGNGTYSLSFDARADLTNDVDEVTLQAQLLSNEKTKTVSFTAPNDGQWHTYTADIETAFDMESTDLVGLHMRTPLNGASEIDYKNLSLTLWASESDLADLKLKAATDRDNPVGYDVGDTIRFDFRLDGVGRLPAEVTEPLYVIWTRRGDDGVTATGTNAISIARGFSVETSLAVPGMVRMTGTLVGPDYTVVSNATVGKITFEGGAGAATERMQLSTVEPADFDAFWAEAKAKLATVPFDDSNVELVDVTPSNLAGSYYVYAAKIPCFGPQPVTGWLTVPKNPTAGGIPVQANFAGYGCISATPSPPTSGSGQVIRFTVNAHGYDLVGRDDQYYRDFNDFINKTNRTFNGKTYTYGLAPQDYDNPTNTYLYYMAMRVMRAFDYLKTRPEWDGTNVVASGGSQGGLQTMWAGGLVDGITKISPSITWGCDIGDPMPSPGPLLSRTWGIPSVPGAYYFDAALHARRVPRGCTAEITRIGLGDYTAPPRGILLSYNNLQCAASAKLVQGSNHDYTPPAPNQTFTLSKSAVSDNPPDDPPDPPAPTELSVSEAPGYDWTNRVITVSGLAVGTEVTLTFGGASSPSEPLTATADSTGVATIDLSATPGALYSYDISTGGVSVVSGTFLSGVWDASGSWFLVEPDGLGGAVETNGTWTTAPATTNATRFVSDESAEFSLFPAARAAGGGRLFRAEATVAYPQIGTLAGLREVVPEAPLAAVAPVENPDGGDAGWAVYNDGAWAFFSGGPVPETGVDYVVRLEGDFTNASSPRVRLSVSGDGGATFEGLSNPGTGTEWLAVDDATKHGLSSIEALGPLGIASMRGTLANAAVAEANGVCYNSLADALRAAGRGGTVTLLTNATAPASLVRDRTIVPNGNILVTYNDWNGTLFFMQ